MYDGQILAGRFRFQLTMFEISIGLSRLLHAHIAYEIAISKITAEYCEFLIVQPDLMLLSSIVCRVQTTRSTIMKFELIYSVVNWQYLQCTHGYGYLDSFIIMLRMIQLVPKLPLKSAEIPIVGHDLMRLISIIYRIQTSRCTMMKFSLVDFVLNRHCLKCKY